MSASIKIELCDERGNRASVEMVAHQSQFVGALTKEAQQCAADLLKQVQENAAKGRTA